MKKKVLVRTNILICIIIVMGFLLTSYISYRSNNGIFRQDIEDVSLLTAEGIYHEIDSIFTKPINISLTMANDSLLKNFLEEEKVKGDEADFVQTMKDYLYAYKVKYNYDSVFLVSTQTNRYYHYETGVDRVLVSDSPENIWYYDFLKSPKEYALNVDNDEVKSADNRINIFINCKIKSEEGDVMGVVGVGFSIDTMQEMFREYEEAFHLRAYLVDEKGMIELSTTKSGYEKTDLFSLYNYGEYRQRVLEEREKMQAFWYDSPDGRGFLVTRYVPNLEWYLLVENNTSNLEEELNRQLFMNILVIFFVISMVLVIVTWIIHHYNEHIVRLATQQEEAHRAVFKEETEKLYENIYELDITHNRAASESTVAYFETLGVPRKVPYDKALQIIAEKQIKEEYREGYLNTFLPANVLKAYEEGIEGLSYDFMTTTDGGYTYYWMRITTRIFYWKEDQSVRMLIYRQNIDHEKRKEIEMAEKMQKDALSGLYNKAVTQERIEALLARNPEKVFAFFMLDIDNFKQVNDTCGHAFGDLVIADFAARLKRQFREDDIVGRIGGDEFVVFVPVLSKVWVKEKAESIAEALQYSFFESSKSCRITASIGVAIMPDGGRNFETLYKNADAALYRTKKNGKKGYTIFS